MVTVSLLDFIGKIDDGVAVILSMIIKEKSYEIMYWFNKNNNFRIVIDDKFYTDFPKIKNIYDYPNLSDLIIHIDQKVLPTREDIWAEFLD